MNTNFPTII